MTRPTITFTLTKPESRLCRDAVNQFGPGPLVDHGEQLLSRAEWFDLARWLTWRATDLEVGLELNQRRASDNLAARIEAVLERWDRVNPPEPVAAEERQKSLVWD